MDYDKELEIYGFDINRKAVAAAIENAEVAGVDDCIKFMRVNVKDLRPVGKNGIIITNPPYGERIGEEKEIAEIYKAYNKFFKENPDWSLFMITTDKEVENKVMEREANRRRKLYNGKNGF
jgi:putative N6-adenine-specific DNA methylase